MSQGHHKIRFELRTLLLVTAIIAVVVSLAVTNWPLVSPDRIRGVRPGMSEAQVFEVMGPSASKSVVYADGGYTLFWSIWPGRLRTVEEAGHIKDQSAVTFSSAGVVVKAWNY